MRRALILLVAGCAASPPATSTEATLDVQMTLTATIDAVTMDGAPVSILPYGQGRMVDPTVTYPTYEDAMAASPIELVFLAQGQAVFVGHARAGECQNICAEQQCPDLSKFTSEHVELGARDFGIYEFDKLVCMGPTMNIVASP